MADGIVRALPIGLGIASLGIVFGAGAAALGWSPLAAATYSALVFAGAAQFATLGLIATGATAMGVLALVALVNARYFLMSAAALDLARQARAGPVQRLLVALGVVDETYALQSAAVRGRRPSVALMLAISGTLWVLWVASTVAGALLGNLVPDLRPYGFDYVLPGIFVGLLGIFADTRARLLAGLGALGLAGALAYAGYATAAVLVVPPLLAFALGRWGPGR